MASGDELNIKDVETGTQDGSVSYSYATDTGRKNDRRRLILLVLLVATASVGVGTVIHFSNKSSSASNRLNEASSAFNATRDESENGDGEHQNGHHEWGGWGDGNKHHRRGHGHNRTECKNGTRTGN